MNVSDDIVSEIYELQKRRTSAYGDENDMNPGEVKSEIQNLVNENGYEKVGIGDYRVVYAKNEFVVKIAWNGLGRKENKAEFRNWMNIKNTPVQRIDGDGKIKARRYLAEAYENFCDVGQFGWICMEKVSVGDDNVTTEEARKLRERFLDAGISIAELRTYNIGRKKHKDLGIETVAVFDYGGK
jgi:mRNA-degrading endonuclease RelE of RelBE toxin-antitoxin system